MTFAIYWSSIITRNKWTPTTKVEVSVEGLEKLVRQAYEKGVAAGRESVPKPTTGARSVFDDILGGLR
jgi:hypothetical protein